MNVHRIHVKMEGLALTNLTNLNVSAQQDLMEQLAEERVSCWLVKPGSTTATLAMLKTTETTTIATTITNKGD